MQYRQGCPQWNVHLHSSFTCEISTTQLRTKGFNLEKSPRSQFSTQMLSDKKKVGLCAKSGRFCPNRLTARDASNSARNVVNSGFKELILLPSRTTNELLMRKIAGTSRSHMPSDWHQRKHGAHKLQANTMRGLLQQLSRDYVECLRKGIIPSQPFSPSIFIEAKANECSRGSAGLRGQTVTK